MATHTTEGAFPKCESMPERAAQPKRVVGSNSKAAVSTGAYLTEPALDGFPDVFGNTASGLLALRQLQK